MIRMTWRIGCLLYVRYEWSLNLKVRDGNTGFYEWEGGVLDCSPESINKDDFTRIPKGTNGLENRMFVLWEKGLVSD